MTEIQTNFNNWYKELMGSLSIPCLSPTDSCSLYMLSFSLNSIARKMSNFGIAWLPPHDATSMTEMLHFECVYFSCTESKHLSLRKYKYTNLTMIIFVYFRFKKAVLVISISSYIYKTQKTITLSIYKLNLITLNKFDYFFFFSFSCEFGNGLFAWSSCVCNL